VTHHCSIYDSLYVSLSLEERCQLVTADEKLYNSLRDVYPGRLLWLGDVTAEMV
jgi:predicted nucleic acid-binding protein